MHGPGRRQPAGATLPPFWTQADDLRFPPPTTSTTLGSSKVQLPPSALCLVGVKRRFVRDASGSGPPPGQLRPAHGRSKSTGDATPRALPASSANCAEHPGRRELHTAASAASELWGARGSQQSMHGLDRPRLYSLVEG